MGGHDKAAPGDAVRKCRKCALANVCAYPVMPKTGKRLQLLACRQPPPALPHRSLLHQRKGNSPKT